MWNNNSDQRISVVTGCYGGIGQAIASALHQAGDRVIGIDHPDAVAQGPAPDQFHGCDLSDMEATQDLATRIATRENVGLLINCAGHYAQGDVFDLTLADLDLSLSVNLRAPFILSQTFGRVMARAGQGVIVNVASIAAHIGSPMAPYGTSKAGMVGLTKSLARAYAPHNIRVNAVAPGITDTAMARDVTPDQMARQIEQVAMGRWAEPQEIAKVVQFLASDAASYMTGSVVDVTGGWIT